MTRIFVYVFRQVLLIRGTRGASSVVNLVWLSPPIVERVTVSPGPILSSFFIVTRCRGILVRSCDPRDTFNEDAGSSYVWTFLFFSLSLSPLSFSRYSHGTLPSLSFFIERDELFGLRSVPHANSSVKGSWKITRHVGTRVEKGPAAARNPHKNVRVVVDRYIATSRWARSILEFNGCSVCCCTACTEGIERRARARGTMPQLEFRFQRTGESQQRSKKVNARRHHRTPSRNSPCHFHFGHIFLRRSLLSPIRANYAPRTGDGGGSGGDGGGGLPRTETRLHSRYARKECRSDCVFWSVSTARYTRFYLARANFSRATKQKRKNIGRPPWFSYY